MTGKDDPTISCTHLMIKLSILAGRKIILEGVVTSAVVDTTFVDIYVDTKNIPTCRYNIQHIDERTMEK